MLSAEDKKLYEACRVIKHSDQLRPFLLWLGEQRVQCTSELETQTDSNRVRLLQGSAQAYKKILELVDDASST